MIHAERDPNLTGLDYANPEEPFINPLKAKVKELDADLGMGMDTDADRFGIVDKGGVYFRPRSDPADADPLSRHRARADRAGDPPPRPAPP